MLLELLLVTPLTDAILIAPSVPRPRGASPGLRLKKKI